MIGVSDSNRALSLGVDSWLSALTETGFSPLPEIYRDAMFV
jgi:hypothetical protein